MRPAILCRLQKGTILDANKGFVDTFNWLVDFCNNLKGDGEINPQKAIIVDRSADDHPIIKSRATGGGSVEVDGVSVDAVPGTASTGDPNANAGALEIKGFSGAGSLTVPRKDSNGVIKFVEASELVNPDGLSIESSGTGADNKLQLKGWNNPSAAAQTLAQDLADSASKGYLLLVRDATTGALAFKSVGVPKSFTWNGTELALVLADDDIEIEDVELVAGENITITPLDNGAKLRISATVPETSGYTASSVQVLADVRYNPTYKTLQKRFYTERWANGILKSRTLGEWQTYHTAVEETVYSPS